MDPRGEDKEPTTRGPGGSDGRWRPLALLGLALLGLALLGLALLGLFGPRTWRPAGCDPPKASPSAFPAPHATSLPRTAVLRGLVLGLQGAPVADAEIQIRPWQLPGPDWWRRAAAIRHTAADDARWTARTGPGGYFQVALPRGRYDVQAGAPGLAWQLAAGQLSGGPLLILELEQGFAIEGILQRFSAAAQVEAEPLVAWETRPTVTARPAPDGSFLLPGLGLGAYRVSAVEETGEIASRAPVAAGTRGLSLTLLAQRGLTGVVLHASHARPVAGALVTVAGSGIWPPRTVRSDPEGRFSFPRLPVGWYALRAVREPDLASGFLEGVQVTASRAETEQGIVVEPHPRITLEVFRGDDGRPVPGAQLLLAPFLPATLAVRVATDASGQARLGPLPPGRYQLSLRAAGLAPLLEQPLEVTPLEEAGPEQSLRVTLQPAAALAGKVVDQAGAPIAGAELEVVGSDGAVGPLPRGADGLIRDRLRRRLGAEGRGGEETVGRSDATGGFRLTPLPPGTWHLVCRHAGHRPALLGPFKLLPGQRQEGIEVRLLLAGLLGGQVVDVEGDPVPFARVRFEGQAGTVTDDRGRFLLEGVWGNGHLLVQAEGYADRRQPVRVEATEPRQPVLVALDERLTPLVGFVLGPQGEEVPGAEVLVEGAGGIVRRLITNQAGDFRLEDPPPPPWTITVTASGAARWQRTLPRQDGPLQIELLAGGSLRLEVLAAGSYEPLPAARLLLTGPERLRWSGTLGNGYLAIDQLTPGRYVARVEADGFLPQELAGLLVEERRDPDPVRLLLVRGGGLAGQVTDLEGRPLAGARLSVSTAGERPERLASVRTDGDGRFRLSPLPEGEVRMTIEADGFVPETVTERVVAEEEYGDLEIRLAPE